ncbi:hypothetical protein QUB19_11420 [Microcoleus sp. B4-C5]
METGNENWLRCALQDKIHQPYREKAMAAAWGEFGVKAEVRAIGLDTQGAQVSTELS